MGVNYKLMIGVIFNIKKKKTKLVNIFDNILLSKILNYRQENVFKGT